MKFWRNHLAVTVGQLGLLKFVLIMQYNSLKNIVGFSTVTLSAN